MDPNISISLLILAIANDEFLQYTKQVARSLQKIPVPHQMTINFQELENGERECDCKLRVSSLHEASGTKFTEDSGSAPDDD